MSISINTNLSAMSAQRRLAHAEGKASQVFERLSSGLRINHAADDAAGLAVSELLRTDARVYGQAIRNVNDAVSALQIAEGALHELTAITLRQRELATQAANELYSYEQRKALDQEADALVNEYNRIVSSTEYNGIKLFENPEEELQIQAGYGTDGTLSLRIGEELARSVGDGTFQAAGTIAGQRISTVAAADVNGDGNADLLTTEANGANLFKVYTGNGDGTFDAPVSYGTLGNTPWRIEVGDFNADGFDDAAVMNMVDTAITIFNSRGDGTFNAGVRYETGGAFTDGAASGGSLLAGDWNNDGKVDLATANMMSDNVSIFTGNGDGTFDVTSIIPGSSTRPRELESADLDHDGNDDLVVAYYGALWVQVMSGNGDGTFAPGSLYSSMLTNNTALGDVNNDGEQDMLVGSYTTANIRLLQGNGDGSFDAPAVVPYAAANVKALEFADFNGDGNLDVLARNAATTATVMLGSGDGTFTSTAYTAGTNQFAAYGSAADAAIADFNNDGALDFAVPNMNDMTVSLFQANPRLVTTITRLDLTSADAARSAMATIDDTLERISSELGAIGSMQSRLGAAVSNLAVSQENYIAAESRITNADVAEEAAQLMAVKIIQQAAASVLAQANQQPSLALKIL